MRRGQNPEWDQFAYWVFSHSNYNSFYMASEFITLHRRFKGVKYDLIEGQKKLMQKIAIWDMGQLIQAILAVLRKKHLGAVIDAQKFY